MSEELQFERAITEAAPASTSGAADASAICASCQTAVGTDYYSVNGNSVCRVCRVQLLAVTETPRGAGPLLRAAAFGGVAGVIGAAIYYGVIAITNFEIGIVAILIGYMVGWAVRKGAGERGGRRFQILAIALTYGAVALAYTPLVFMDSSDQSSQAGTALTKSGAEPASTAVPEDDAAAAPSSGGFVVGIVFLLGFIAALPVMMVVGSLPSGLISAAIIFFGMRQAWAMTGIPRLEISGPYRVGAAVPTAPPA